MEESLCGSGGDVQVSQEVHTIASHCVKYRLGWKPTKTIGLNPLVYKAFYKISLTCVLIIIGCTYSRYMSHTYLNIIPDLSRCGMCFWDGRPCARNGVRRIAKCTLKEFEEVSEVQTPHRMWGYGCFSRQPCTFFALLGGAPLFRMISLQISRDSGCILTHYLRFCFPASFLALAFITIFCCFDVATVRPLSTATALGTINLRKCIQLFVNWTLIAFLSVMDFCAQTTPLDYIVPDS